MYEYKATIKSNHDGDTLRIDIDLGFGTLLLNQAIRLYGVNAFELKDAGGKEARDFVASKLPEGTEVIITTLKDKREKYGRYLAKIKLPDGTDLSESLIAAGHAIPYFG